MGAASMAQAPVQPTQTIAAAFSPVALANTGTPTAGTTWVPRWREPAPAPANVPASSVKPVGARTR
jgi:hypothetical protein